MLNKDQEKTFEKDFTFEQAEKKQVRLTVLSTMVGTALEWYDFYLYATASALVFNKLFFPQLSPAMGTLAAFGSYGVGFLIRPLGGVIFGHVGDRYGRRPVMVITLLLMGFSTCLVGLLPSFAQIGILAPILLTLCRAMQGLGAGAEFSSAIVLAAERASPRHRGFLTSLAGVGIAAGIVLSAGAFGLVSSMPQDAFLTYGWRIPFLASIFAVALGIWIRLYVSESPVFTKLQNEHKVEKSPIMTVWRESKREFLIAFGARMAENCSGFFLQVWALSYLTSQLKMSSGVGLTAVLCSAGIGMLVIPLWGAISDRIGRRPVFLGGALLFGLGIFPMFWIFETRNSLYITLALIVMIAGANYSMFSVESAFFVELFPSHTRVSGIALSRELSAVFAGGLAPIVSSALVVWSGGSYVPVAWYMIAMALITVVALVCSPETKDREIGAD